VKQVGFDQVFFYRNSFGQETLTRSLFNHIIKQVLRQKAQDKTGEAKI